MDWDDVDRYSFEDSDRFEEDSMCSWSSEPESICNNWRGWKKPPNTNGGNGNTAQSASHYGFGAGNKRSSAEGCSTDPLSSSAKYPSVSDAALDLHHPRSGVNHSAQQLSNANQQQQQQVPQLVELAAKCVASHIPFELVENVYPPVPEQLQLRIAFWSFPDNEEDIRLYSCLANGSAEEFTRGDLLYRTVNVKNPLQIGFHLSASVISLPRMTTQKVAVTFDRRRISSCNCTCNPTTYWCSHVVAVCLTRIHWPHLVTLRAPVSESLSRLQRDQLQKFAQYLISELPQQILPTAQRLLDELLGSQPSVINSVCGAPDPTAGASATDQTTWYLDVKALHQNIKKILIKFCIPAPIVFSDVNFLSNSAPPAASEWTSLLRPLRGREPEGMWNLLSIVREMFKRNDRNAIPLLEIITDECLSLEQILLWWFNTKVALLNGSPNQPTYSSTTTSSNGKHNVNSNMHTSQHACSSLCDEIAVLWRLAALNPGLAPQERDVLHHQFTTWHLKVTERVSKCRSVNTINGGGGANGGSGAGGGGANSTAASANKNGFKLDLEVFTGFKPAIEACYLDWDDYPMPGITYTVDSNPMYHCPFTCFKQSERDKLANAEGVHRVSQVNCSKAALHGGSLMGFGLLAVGGRYKGYGGQLHHSRVTRLDFNQPQPSTSASTIHPPLVAPISTINPRAAVQQNNTQPSTSALNAPSQHHHESGNRSSVSSEGFCENDDDSASISTSHQQHLLNLHHMHHLMSLALVSSNNEQVGYDGRHHSSRHHTRHGRQQMMGWNAETEAGSDTSSGSSSGVMNSRSNNGLIVNDMIQITSDSASPSCQNTSSGSGSDSNNELEPKKDPLLVTSQLTSTEIVRADGAGTMLPGASKDLGNYEASASSSHSSSPHSIEEFNTYFYNGQDATTTHTAPHTTNQINPSPPTLTTIHQFILPQAQPSSAAFVSANQPTTSNQHPHQTSTDPWDVLFSRAEGLHAHGHAKEACRLSEQLAEELLAHPPDLMLDHHVQAVPRRKGKRQQVNPATHQLSCLASATLAKCAFLCSVLAENSFVMESNSHLAFKVGMFGLELARPPASTKPLEVKLANQESDLVALLKRIPLRYRELQILRERATMLKDGTLKSRGEALLPLLLSSFIFDALVMPGQGGTQGTSTAVASTAGGNMVGMSAPSKGSLRLVSDEPLAFEAAVAALGLKANVSEAEHPLLCEGTRRQRSDLAIMLLLYYKDNCWKLARIMNRLLDREMHQMLKSPIMSSYYSRNPPIKSQYTHLKRDEAIGEKVVTGTGLTGTYLANTVASSIGHMEMNSSGEMGSRPHSATSAELEQGISNISIASTSTNLPTSSTNGSNNGNLVATPMLGTPCSSGNIGSGTVTVITSTRTKDGRFKGKRVYPSIPNQPSEAGAHFFCELAKLVLTKAGGNMSTSLFTQASANQNMHVVHRALHMCAFQLFLYALGLHNCVTPNWLSRTYSSHVSWITGQAMEIGAAAISFLIETWEGHLTPPEAASIADRASRGCDTNMVRAAAELALSVLPHAAALNPNEIIRAILQCKEQSDVMLEHACLTVENAAKGGGVYPEVLFQVARYWYNLYVHHSPDGDQIMEQDIAQMMPPSVSANLISSSGGAVLSHEQQHHAFLDGYGPAMMMDPTGGGGAVYSGPPMLLSEEQVQQLQAQQQAQLQDLQQLQQQQSTVGMMPTGVQMIQGTGQLVTNPGVGQVVPVQIGPGQQGPVVTSAVTPAGTVVTSTQPPPPAQFMPYAAYSFTVHHPHSVGYGGPIHPHHQLHHHSMHHPSHTHQHQMHSQHHPQHHHGDSMQPVRSIQMAPPPLQQQQQVQQSPSVPQQQQPPLPPQHMQIYHLTGPPTVAQNEIPPHLIQQQQQQAPPPQYVTYAQQTGLPPPQVHAQSGQQSPQQVQPQQQLSGGPLKLGPSIPQQQQQQQFQMQQQMQQVQQGQLPTAYPSGSYQSLPLNTVAYAQPPPKPQQQPPLPPFQQPPQLQQQPTSVMGPVMAAYVPQNTAVQYAQQVSIGPPPQLPQQQYYGAAVTLSQPTRPTHMYPATLPPPPQAQQPPSLSCNPQQQVVPLAPSQHHHHHHVVQAIQGQPGPSHGQQQLQQPLRHQHQLSAQQMRCLLAAYRVGMLAMETLARRVHDDRPQAKYARNPPYGEDVKWLLRISKHLGSQYLHQFCVCAVNSIISPFILHDVAVEAAQHLSRGSNPGLVLRTALSPLVQKCQQMYIQCMHQKLYHLSPQDYEDFVSIVCVARAAFQITPDGSAQFKEWLQSIKRSKSCKKELWSMINTALQANGK